MIIEPLKKTDEESLIRCVQASFPAPQGEVMARVLDITADDYLSYTELVCHKAVREGFTIVAKEYHGGEVIGFCIAEDFVTAPDYRLLGVSSKFRPLLNILDELDRYYIRKRLGEGLGPIAAGDIFHLYMLGVDPTHQSRRVAPLLAMACIEKAKLLGFKSVIAEATGKRSQALCQSLGFSNLYEVPYETFQSEGQLWFKEITSPRGCVLVEMCLGD